MKKNDPRWMPRAGCKSEYLSSTKLATAPGIGKRLPAEEALRAASDHPAPRLTVLRAAPDNPFATARPWATKRFTRHGVVGYGRATWFEHREVEAPTVDDLARLMGELAGDPHSFVVLGRVRPALRDAGQIRRLLHSRGTGERREPRTLDDVPARVLHVDVDKLPVPEGHGWHDPAAMAGEVWRILGERVPAFQGVRVVWQASSSAAMPGKEGTARFHFWPLLSEGLDADRRKALLKMAGADLAPHSAAQAGYTAAPVFDGVPDPLAGLPRGGVIEGARGFVPVDRIAFPAKPEGKSRRQGGRLVAMPEAPGAPTKTTAYGRAQLEHACAGVKKTTEGRNVEIYRKSFWVGGLVSGGEIAMADAEAALLEAGEATGHARFREAVRNGLRDGLAVPIVRAPEDEPVAPYWSAPTLSRADAVAAHRRVVGDWAEAVSRGEAPRVMLTGGQGSGKTSTLVGRDGKSGALHRMQGRLVLMLLPDHRKAAEAAADYAANAPAGAPPSLLLRGRAAKDPATAEAMCRIPDAADLLARRGVNVRKELCAECPFQHGCAYLRQEAAAVRLGEDAAEFGGVVFGVHDHAGLPLPGKLKPDATIFDERPRDLAVTGATITLEALGQRLAWTGPRHAKTYAGEVGEHVDALAGELQHIRPLAVKLRQAAEDQPHRIMGALRDAGVTRDDVSKALAALADFEDRSTGAAAHQAIAEWKASGGRFDLQQRIVSKARAGVPSTVRALAGVFRAILQEIDHGRDEAVALTVGPVPRKPGATERGPGIRAVWLRKPRHGVTGAFLHLDGTGDADMARAIFGADLVHEHHPIERNARIVQVVGHSFAKQRITGINPAGEPLTGEWAERAEATRAALHRVLARYPEAAVFAAKPVIEALGLAQDARAGHFGALRGQNGWEAAPVAIVIGREQPSPRDVESIARAYAAAAGDGFQAQAGNYPTERRGIRLRNGGAHAVEVPRHPDPWGGRVLHAIREAEIAQAIDRVRLVHNREPKQVFILGEVVADVTVDEVTSWAEFQQGGSRPMRALAEHGVLPLGAREAARVLPSIWESKSAADRDLADWATVEKVSQTVYREVLYTKWDTFSGLSLHLCRYRIFPTEQAPRPREQWAWVSAPRGRAQERLAAVAGKLADFQTFDIIEIPQPAGAEDRAQPAERAPAAPVVPLPAVAARGSAHHPPNRDPAPPRRWQGIERLDIGDDSVRATGT